MKNKHILIAILSFVIIIFIFYVNSQNFCYRKVTKMMKDTEYGDAILKIKVKRYNNTIAPKDKLIDHVYFKIELRANYLTDDDVSLLGQSFEEILDREIPQVFSQKSGNKFVVGMNIFPVSEVLVNGHLTDRYSYSREYNEEELKFKWSFWRSRLMP